MHFSYLHTGVFCSGAYRRDSLTRSADKIFDNVVPREYMCREAWERWATASGMVAIKVNGSLLASSMQQG